MAEALRVQLGQLSLETKNNKAEEFLEISTEGNFFISSLFKDHKLVGSFQINEKLEYSNDVEYTKLIPVDSFKKNIGTYLGTDYDKAVLIEDYSTYHKLKEDYFLKWLSESGFFESVEKRKYKKPDFICSGGKIAYPMMTPWITRFGDWEIFAAKFNDCIFLSSEEYSEIKDKESYYGIYFEHIMTHSNPKEYLLNEFDKFYVINEVTFGSHQILCMNEIDAVNEKGEWVEIKVYKECSPQGMSGKHLKYWAQSIVPGVKHLVIGKRNDSGHLLDIKTTTVNAIADKLDWGPALCYEFEHRLLHWIKSHFIENNQNIVKKFSWICGHCKVTSVNVVDQKISKLMFPEWFVNKMEEINKKINRMKETDKKEDK